MQNGLPYLDILIFAIIAVFLIFRLKNILGTKTGFEDTNLTKDNMESNLSNVVPLTSLKEKQNTVMVKIFIIFGVTEELMVQHSQTKM